MGRKARKRKKGKSKGNSNPNPNPVHNKTNHQNVQKLSGWFSGKNTGAACSELKQRHDGGQYDRILIDPVGKKCVEENSGKTLVLCDFCGKADDHIRSYYASLPDKKDDPA